MDEKEKKRSLEKFINSLRKLEDLLEDENEDPIPPIEELEQIYSVGIQWAKDRFSKMLGPEVAEKFTCFSIKKKYENNNSNTTTSNILSSNDPIIEDKLVYLLHTGNWRLVITLLEIQFSGQKWKSRVNDFFQWVIQFQTSLFYLMDEADCWVTLSKIFDYHQPFYKDDEAGQWKTYSSNQYSEKLFPSVSFLIKENVNYFGDIGGFDMILLRFRSQMRPKPSILYINSILSFIKTLNLHLSPVFSSAWHLDLLHSIQHLVLNYTSQELKDLSTRKNFTKMISYLYNLSGLQHNGKPIEKFWLKYIRKCLHSESLEKRLNAYMDINELIERAEERENPSPLEESEKVLPTRYLDLILILKWLGKNNVLDCIFNVNNFHEESIKRAGPILSLFARGGELEFKHLDSLWDCSLDKQEPTVEIIYQVIRELLWMLTPNQIDYLLDKIRKISHRLFTRMHLDLLNSICSCCLHSQSDYFKETDRTFGLDILWDLALNPSARLAGEALDCLVSQLHKTEQVDVHNKYLQLSVDLLKGSKFVIPALRMIEEILVNYREQTPLIEKKFQLADEFFKEFVTFKETFWNQRHRAYNQQHLEQQAQETRARLTFLNFLTENANVTLSLERTSKLWDCLIGFALSPAEQNIGFQWFAEACDNQLTVFDRPSETCTHLLQERLALLNFAKISPQAFDCWRRFFVLVNQDLAAILPFEDASDDFLIVNWRALAGLDLLWEIAVHVEDPGVSIDSILFLTDLLRKISPELHTNRLELHTSFLDKIMQYLAHAHTSDAHPRASAFLVNRCIDLLQHLLDYEVSVLKRYRRGDPLKLKFKSVKFDTFELETHSYATLGDLAQRVCELTAWKGVRFIFGGKVLREYDHFLDDLRITHGCTLNFMEDRQGLGIPSNNNNNNNATVIDEKVDVEQLEGVFPSGIISREPKYLDRLFDLFDVVQGNTGLEAKVWDLICILPENPAIRRNIVQFPPNPDWSTILLARNPFRFLYALKIVQNRLLQDSNWKDAFVKSNGAFVLYKILLTNAQVQSNERCATTLLATLCLLLLNTDPTASPTTDFSHSLPVLIPETVRGFKFDALMDLLFKLVAQVLKDPLTENHDFIESAMALALALAIDSPELLYASPTFVDLLHIALFRVPNPSIRETVTIHLKLLAESHINFDSKSQHPANFLLDLLASRFLGIVTPQEQNTEHFFALFQTLISWAKLNEKSNPRPLQFWIDLFSQLVQKLNNYPLIESDQSEQPDVVLSGVLQTLEMLARDYPKLKGCAAEKNLIFQLFSFLYTLPTVSAHGIVQPPVCKTEISRRAATELLCTLAAEKAEIQETCFELIDRFSLQLTEDDRQLPWDYSPAAHQRSGVGYVGLKNLGCTCYMNSLIQQLFMIPQFRRGILSFECTDKNLEDSQMYQLQTTFAYLQESQLQFYNPEAFCKTNKDYEGQPLDLYQQMDVDEYFNMLCENLESTMKNSLQNNLGKNIWGGTMSTQLICKGCPHRYERDDEFSVLPLDINHKNSLSEALDGYITSELLENDNAYNCARCGSKRDTRKRSVLKHLPNTLIISLKRFAFNYDVMKKVKLNSYCEFPETLDLKKYTTVGVSEQDQQEEEAEEQGEQVPLDLNEDDEIRIHALEEARKRPDAYYQYKLVGVVVHRGTADFGHYYSFIQERVPVHGEDQLRWLQFNDKEVTRFDLNNLQEECFGGQETVEKWDSNTRAPLQEVVDKTRNAYLLIYERQQPFLPLYTSDVAASERGTTTNNNNNNNNNNNTHNSHKNPEDSRKNDEEQRLGKNLQTAPRSAVSQMRVAFWAALFIGKLKGIQRYSQNRLTWSAPVPRPLFARIWEENSLFYREKAVLADDFHKFICLLLKEYHIVPPNTTELNRSNSEGEEQSFKVIKFAVTFYFNNISRSAARTWLGEVLNCLKSFFLQHHPSIGWIIKMICCGTKLNNWLICCPLLEIRSTFSDLLLFLIKSLMSHEKHALSNDVIFETSSSSEMDELEKASRYATNTGFLINSIINLLWYGEWTFKYFDQAYRFLWEFAKLSDSAMAYLIKNDAISWILWHFLKDENNNARKISKGKRLKKAPAVPDSKFALDLLHHLICSSHTRFRFYSEDDPPKAKADITDSDEEDESDTHRRVHRSRRNNNNNSRWRGKEDDNEEDNSDENNSSASNTGSDSRSDSDSESDEFPMGRGPPPPTLLRKSNIFVLKRETSEENESGFQPLSNSFIKKLVTCGTNPRAAHNILNHWAWGDTQVLRYFYGTICTAYNTTDYDSLTPIFEAFEALLLFEAPDSQSRITIGLEMFLKEVDAKRKAPKKTRNAALFLKALQEKSDQVDDYFTTNWESLSWLFSYQN